jgi:beta-phosphoglucomutase
MVKFPSQEISCKPDCGGTEMLKGVIFDLDGTVIDSTVIDYEAMRKAFADIEISFSYEDYITRVGGRGEEMVRSKADLSKDEVQNLLERKAGYFREAVLENPVRLIPGIENFLRDLKNVPMWTALATGSSKEKVDLVLEHSGISHYFDIIVTSDDVKSGKPDPSVFLKAAESLNLQPEECIVFEDAVMGIKAARNAGMKVIAVKTSSSFELISEADLILESYSDPELDSFFEKEFKTQD